MNMRRIIRGAVAALFVSTAAQATTVTIDGVAKTLGSFTIDSTGAIVLTTSSTPVDPGVSYALTVNATSNGSILVNGAVSSGSSYPSGTVLTLTVAANSGYTQQSWTDACSAVAAGSPCTVTMDAAKAVGATFVASTTTPPSDGACGEVPTNVTVKDLSWTANTGNSNLENLGGGIIAYRITPATARSGDFGVAFTGGVKAMKSIVISACPGAMDKPVGTYCSGQGYEYGSVTYASRAPGTTVRYSCNIDVGKTYYINVKNSSLAEPNVNTCSGSNCPYYWTFR